MNRFFASFLLSVLTMALCSSTSFSETILTCEEEAERPLASNMDEMYWKGLEPLWQNLDDYNKNGSEESRLAGLDALEVLRINLLSIIQKRPPMLEGLDLKNDKDGLDLGGEQLEDPQMLYLEYLLRVNNVLGLVLQLEYHLLNPSDLEGGESFKHKVSALVEELQARVAKAHERFRR